jgi:hypothetical protein
MFHNPDAYGVRNGNIVTPFSVAQNPLLHASGALAEKSLGSIGQDTKHNFVKDLFGLR